LRCLTQNRIYLLFFFLLIFYQFSFSQNEIITVYHPIYNFLLKANVENLSHTYDHFTIPLTRKKIQTLISEIDSFKTVNVFFNEQLLFYKNFFSTPVNEIKSLIGDKSGSVNDFISSKKENYLYRFNNDLYSLTVNPLITYKFLCSDLTGTFDNTNLVTYGGSIKFNYSSWLTTYLEAWNGFNTGNREIALTDKRVNQSYSFNKTKLNFFDGTQGYIQLDYDIFSFTLGRLYLKLGISELNRSLISDVSPAFDFIKFSVGSDKVNYTFIHGWLIQQPEVKLIDSIIGDIKYKNAKYIALSRLAVKPFDDLRLGVAQAIIYGSRPFEATYLNPFLLWESAQRSLNDLDNSFLSFDARYKLVKGIEIYASIIFDDINFKFFSESWNTMGNRLMWQTGFIYSSPLNLYPITIYVDYSQIRPYTFSHPGVGEALTYTNNGNPLGVDAEPNSKIFTARIDYDFSPSLKLKILYQKNLHGSDIYDENGKLIQIVGGSYFHSTNFYSNPVAKMLDGILEKTNKLQLNLSYYYSYNISFDFFYQYKIYQKEKIEKKSNLFWFQTNFGIF